MRILVFSDTKKAGAAAAAQFSTCEIHRVTFEAGDLDLIETLPETDTRDGIGILAVVSNPDSFVTSLRRSGISLPLVAAVASHEPSQAVRLLDAGCDDVMNSPPDPAEVAARFRAISRRASSALANSIRCGRLVAYIDGRDPEIDGKRVKLTKIEYAILDTLIRRAGSAVSRETLFNRVWPDSDKEPFDKVLDVHIHNLRRKLADTSGGERFIETLPQRGYILTSA